MKKVVLKKNCIKELNTSHNYLEEYLLTLGIKAENVASFIGQPKDSDADQPMMLSNMKEAVVAAYDEMNKGTPVFIQVDADTDGFTSAAIIYNYIKRRFPYLAVSYALHHGKEHGIVPEVIPENCGLVIIPDAGSNDIEQQKELIKAGKKIIILDHHEVNKDIYEELPDVILVNNQVSPLFSNKNLSGAGVAYLFIQAMDQTMFAWDDHPAIYRDYRDLAAVGIIADAMNMTALGNNYLAYYGLQNIKNPFIKELALKQSRGIKNPNNLSKVDVAFYIAPVINGVIRSGTMEDKETVFKAMITSPQEGYAQFFTTEWRGKTRHENIYEYAVRLATNAKSRQDSAKKKSFEWLCERIVANKMEHDPLIIVTLNAIESAKVSANITGLIAMELVKYFNRPCLVLRETEFEGQKVYGGSGRNGSFYGFDNLLHLLQESGCVLYAAGHANAFGCFIEPNQVDALRNYAAAHINTSSFEDDCYEVDYEFKPQDLCLNFTKEILADFGRADHLWGNGIPRPLFAFNLPFNYNEIQLMGADKTSMKIHYPAGIDFVSFKNEQLINELSEAQTGMITIIGSPTINEWRGSETVQIIIDDAIIYKIITMEATAPIIAAQKEMHESPPITMPKKPSLLDLI